MRVLDLDAQASREFALADNARDFGEDDDAAVQAILAGADDDFAAILAGNDESVIDVDVLDVDDVVARTAEGRFSLTIRGPLVVQPEVFEKLRAVLEQIEGVTVDASWL